MLMDWAETRGNKEDDERGVYITNVDETVDDSVFKEHFSKFGVIEKVVYGRLIGHARRKDFAIINFATRESAKKCIKETNGTKFMNRYNTVAQYAREEFVGTGKRIHGNSR